VLITLPCCPANFSTKCSASSGISSHRSRSGGSVIGNTFSL
jgi:hypothetical protein